MALLNLRAYTNPAGVTFDANQTDKWYANDALELKSALLDGTKDIQPQVCFTKDGVQLNSTSAQPVASASVRGRLWIQKGADGAPDKIQVCVKRSNDTYIWMDLLEAD